MVYKNKPMLVIKIEIWWPLERRGSESLLAICINQGKSYGCIFKRHLEKWMNVMNSAFEETDCDFF